MLWAERGRHKFNVELRGACVYLRRLVKVSHLYGHVLVSCSARVGSVCSMCSEQLVQDAPHHHCTAFHHLEGAFAIGDGMAWHGMVGKMHSEITGNRTQVICLRCLPMSMVAGLAAVSADVHGCWPGCCLHSAVGLFVCTCSNHAADHDCTVWHVICAHVQGTTHLRAHRART